MDVINKIKESFRLRRSQELSKSGWICRFDVPLKKYIVEKVFGSQGGSYIDKFRVIQKEPPIGSKFWYCSAFAPLVNEDKIFETKNEAILSEIADLNNKIESIHEMKTKLYEMMDVEKPK